MTNKELIQLQVEFTECLGQLIAYAYQCGYGLTIGDGARLDHRGHKPRSKHYVRLAHDFNLMKRVDGDLVYLTKTSEYKFLGDYWETLHPKASWGGRFSDGNHFSFLEKK